MALNLKSRASGLLRFPPSFFVILQETEFPDVIPYHRWRFHSTSYIIADVAEYVLPGRPCAPISKGIYYGFINCDARNKRRNPEGTYTWPHDSFSMRYMMTFCLYLSSCPELGPENAGTNPLFGNELLFIDGQSMITALGGDAQVVYNPPSVN